MTLPCPGSVAIPECTTVQIIEPSTDLIVDTAGTTSDLDERGDLPLTQGQTTASVTFLAQKLNANYHFEYLYVDAQGNVHPGAVVVVPVTWTIAGFSVVFAGSPIGAGYVLRWRVVIVTTTTLVQTDAPEDLYLQMPRTNLMAITFLNPRSSTTYGFAELRVENLIDPPAGQAVIAVQPYVKTFTGFGLAVNPTPPSDNYFLRVRTP
jgi:hypothetical protein